MEKKISRFVLVVVCGVFLASCGFNPYQPLILAAYGDDVPEGFPEAVAQEKPDLSGVYRWRCRTFSRSGKRNTYADFYWLMSSGGNIKETARRFEIKHQSENVIRMTALLDFGERYEHLDIDVVYEAPWYRLTKPVVWTPPTYVRLGLDKEGNLIGYEPANYHFQCKKSPIE